MCNIALVLRNIIRVFRVEGIAGIYSRLKYRRRISLADIPQPLRLSDICKVLDNGNTELARIVCDSLCIFPEAESGDLNRSGVTLHIGWPDDLSVISFGDIVVSVKSHEKISVPGPVMAKLGLILESDPGRLAWLSRQPTGYPHYLYLPSAPESCAVDDWIAYKKDAEFYFKRVALFLGGEVGASDSLQSLDLMPVDNELRVCLSLPEHPSRRHYFESLNLLDFQIFDGFRVLPAWKGAAVSYRALAKYSLENGVTRLIVAQDDMVPVDRFKSKLATAIEFFSEHDFDVFCGLVTVTRPDMFAKPIASLDDCALVELDSSVGLVFNIFGKRALERMSQWGGDADTAFDNTIDQYMSKSGLKVLTCVPSLVLHNSSLHSTIWEFSNARYDSVINQSHAKLSKAGRSVKCGQD